MRLATLIAAAALAATAPAFAHNHTGDHTGHAKTALAAVIASDIRADDRARDQYRHPAETLAFFQVEPNMKVGEYSPGGGWYTRILAPYVAAQGQYVALWYNTDATPFSGERNARVIASATGFPQEVAQWTGMDAAKFPSLTMNAVGNEHQGTFDRILLFRTLHGLSNWNMFDIEMKAIRGLLKDDGMVGIVQHRAADGATHEYSTGPKGYVSEEAVIALMDFYGFDLIESSEINANPADTANHAEGVWHLPPTLGGTEDTDTAERAARQAIGESDRMTLLFAKK